MGTEGLQWNDEDNISDTRMNQKTNYIAPSTTPPPATYAGMIWFQTDLNILVERSGDNTTWLQIYPISDLQHITQVEIDFGDVNYVTEQAFTITDPNVLPTSHITASLAYDAPTDKDLDEVEMDELEIMAGQCQTGSFTLFVKAMEDSVYGAFKINYMVG